MSIRRVSFDAATLLRAALVLSLLLPLCFRRRCCCGASAGGAAVYREVND